MQSTWVTFFEKFCDATASGDGAVILRPKNRRIAAHGQTVYMLATWPMLALRILAFGRKALAHIAVEVGIFVDSAAARIVFRGLDGPSALPPRTFVSCHHRRDGHTMDLYLMYLLADHYDDVFVMVNAHWPRATQAVMKHIYGAVNLLHNADKFWTVVEPLLTARRLGRRVAVVVFPDRDGSQFFGDVSMSPRDGLYAAAMAYDLPIIDTCFVTAPDTDAAAQVTVQQMPRAAVCNDWFSPSEGPAAFAEWRRQNGTNIGAYKWLCHGLHMQALQSMEATVATCAVDAATATCSLSESSKIEEIEISVNKNRAAAVLSSTFMPLNVQQGPCTRLVLDEVVRPPPERVGPESNRPQAT